MFAWSPKVGWGSKGRSKVGRVLSTANLRRKLVVIAWHMLSKGEDYAFARPPLVREKIRRLSEAKNDSPTQEMNAWRIRQAAPPPSVTATF